MSHTRGPQPSTRCNLVLAFNPASCFLEDTWKMPQMHEEQSILLGEIRGCLICPLPSLTTGRTGVRLLQVRSHLLEANPA